MDKLREILRRKHNLVRTVSIILVAGTITSAAMEAKVQIKSSKIPFTQEDLYNNEIFIEQENYDKEHSLIAFMNEDIRKIIENKVGEITLKSLDSIEELTIEGPLSNNYLEDLRQLKNLKTLVINNMEINAMQLEHNQNLTDITFNNCTINNFDKLPNTIKKLQTYRTNVNGNYMAIPYEAEEVSIWASNIRNIIFKNPKQLKSLHIRGEVFIDMKEIAKCSNLENLTIIGCSNVKNPQYLTKLKKLKQLSTLEYGAVWLDKETLEKSNFSKEEKELLGYIIDKLDYAVEYEIPYGETDEEKIRNISIYLLNNMIYDNEQKDISIIQYNEYPFTAVFASGMGVCTNYTCLFQALANRMGLDNYRVIGNNHTWNVVEDKCYDLATLDENPMGIDEYGNIVDLQTLTAMDFFNRNRENALFSYSFDFDKYAQLGYTPENMPVDIQNDIINIGYIKDGDIIQVRRNFKTSTMVMTKGLRITLNLALLMIASHLVVNNAMKNKRNKKLIKHK